MAAALTKLKGFIQTYTGLIFANISEVELDELKSFITQAISTIRWEIEDDVSLIKDQSAKTIYILALQFQLTYLVDGINGFQHDDSNLLIASGLFDWLSFSIYELLEHVREYFGDYFDFDAELPLHFFERYGSSNPLFGKVFNERLNSNNVNPELSALILGFSQATNKTERFKIRTWRQWDY